MWDGDELVINLKTAKALGSTIPQSLLLRAGFVLNSFETSEKRLEVLKDTLPHLSRVGLLYDPGQASTKRDLDAAGHAARALSLQLDTAAIRGPASLDQAFTALGAQGVQAIAVPSHSGPSTWRTAA